MARAAGWGQIPGYLNHANDEICLLVQVETEAGDHSDSKQYRQPDRQCQHHGE